VLRYLTEIMRHLIRYNVVAASFETLSIPHTTEKKEKYVKSQNFTEKYLTFNKYN